MRHFLVIFATIVLATGCRQIQLRNNTTRQARTISDLHTQQVLDNLAMFVYSPGSFPSFSTFSQGTSMITDKASIAPPVGFGRFTPANIFGLTTLAINSSLGRDANEAWTMQPVNNPRKLELMRCAYQRAVSGLHPTVTACPNCQRRFQSFYTGLPNGNIGKVDTGIVTSDCLASDSCWFHVGCKHCVPKSCDCLYVGQYCGEYIWVAREGRDELAKLTLAILDYAVNEPPKVVSPTKQVIIKRGKDGSVESVQITADIAMEDSVESLIEAGDISPKAKAKRELRQLLSEKGVTLEALKSLGPLNAGRVEAINSAQGTRVEDRLTTSDKARLIQLLSILGLEPAEAALSVANQTGPSVQQALEAALADPSVSAALNEKLKRDLRSIDLSGPPPLTPLVIPSLPTPSSSLDLLQLRQQLNTVTPQPTP